MKFRISITLVLLTLSGARLHAQQKVQPEKGDDRVVVTTNLVQVDAVVTDKNGKQVTDLRPEDFELIEDGHLRPIIAFSYIDLVSKETASRLGQNPNRIQPPTTLNAIRPESVRRAIAIVVDDFGLSFESIARLRDALEKFIQDETLPGDYIAVIRTSAGPGAMLQFTSNRAHVLATIKRLRWYPTGRGSMSALESTRPLDNNGDGVELKGYSTNRPPDLSSKEFFGGSLGALNFVLEGLSRFPGRKSIVLVSENLPVTTREAQISGVAKALDGLTDRANRYSIVINTIDARGLPKAGLTADDNQYDLAANQVEKRVREGRIKFNVDQDALSYIARQTGGTFIHNNNNLNASLHSIVESEEGYYLLAYRPDDAESGDRGRAYKVTLRLKRPGLLLRTRNSFHRFAPAREDNETTKTTDDLLRDSLASPFVKEDVRLKVTALFTGRSQVKVLLHVDARDLVLTKSAQGNYTGSFDIAAVAFDDNGKVVQQARRNQALSVRPEMYERLLREGFVYSLTMPIEKPGPYQVRAALQDDSSGRLGSDSQFVEVPDIKKSRLFIAGFVVQGIANDAASSRDVSVRPGSSAEKEQDVTGKGPGVRRFVRGEAIEYSYLIYGAKTNSANDSSNLLSQVRLFHRSEQVFAGNAMPVSLAKEPNHEGIVGGGSIKLGTGLPPGEYFLQLVITDKSAPPDKQPTEQWIDFQIVE